MRKGISVQVDSIAYSFECLNDISDEDFVTLLPVLTNVISEAMDSFQDDESDDDDDAIVALFDYVRAAVKVELNVELSEPIACFIGLSVNMTEGE